MTDINHSNPYAAPPTIEDDVVNPNHFFDGRLRITAIGLKMIHAGILIVMVFWIAAFPLSMFGFGTPIVGAVFSIGPLSGLLLMNIGPFLCLTVPRESGLRPYAVSAVVAQVLAVICIVNLVSATPPTTLATIAAPFCMTMAAMLFLAFLSRLARCIERFDLAMRARTVTIFAGVVLFVFLPAAMLIEFSSFSNFGMILWIIVTFLFLFLLAFCARLANALGNAIWRPRIGETPLGGA